jgi:hypothetical protein
MRNQRIKQSSVIFYTDLRRILFWSLWRDEIFTELRRVKFCYATSFPSLPRQISVILF